ncbi:MAG: ATP synthase F1 subunit gamma [Candidatus Latescibacteria bacterium]|nr:ATP synthase F1 subunit gamma [Candidatus Latescibacterota bacterium]
MPNLRMLRRRIISVKNIQQVTNAMRMVAAARMRRSQENMMASRPYSRKMGALLRHVASLSEQKQHPLLIERELKHVCLVVITSDRGLCGSFNSNIIRRAVQQVRSYQKQGVDVSLVCVGRKGRDFFARRDYTILGEHLNIFGRLGFHHAQAIVKEILYIYTQLEVDRVEIVYNEFRSALQQNLLCSQFLPVIPEAPDRENGFTDYLYEPSQKELLDELLPRHLNVQIWQMLLESNASEQAARMTAMENATKNARELVDDLTLVRNKVRQATITREIAEIVGGAEALKG